MSAIAATSLPIRSAGEVACPHRFTAERGKNEKIRVA